ncbi:MAG: hypothetical protein AAF950_14245 [Pseudomonadota bacterium]
MTSPPTNPLKARLSFMRVIVRFLVPYVTAVFVASVSLVTTMVTRDAARKLPSSEIYPAPFESVFIVAPLIAMFALIPAILATLIVQRGEQDKAILRLALFGLGTGLIIMLDFLSWPTGTGQWGQLMGEKLLKHSWTILMFGVSGALGRDNVRPCQKTDFENDLTYLMTVCGPDCIATCSVPCDPHIECANRPLVEANTDRVLKKGSLFSE